ncbi:tyrosine-protein phosphatase [Aureibacter tunicatorum]|uniref:Protein tyrosine/serine phosphatase/predicted phosphodiesterase n=1 Tax=Aureibacter tunicatorum TaxID=866807 RepID=A0AAE3XLK9_9BACT|nr:tyrosine-protein phosphatase [Aureibacter tunicatorum]MDR6238253.1 protein tyrosine/serine phosphatase/predicted phosphodiesterase [Aureibacter tunicatorum]BDD03286.1 hypothetical protein AUTU_07690 [Aureibacter tunicatorum]
MKRSYFLKGTLLLFAMIYSLTWSMAQDKISVDYRNYTSQPHTALQEKNKDGEFQFAIVSDRTGGHRAGVFKKGIEKINLIQPEFIVSVGDLIEGYTTDEKEINDQWNEFDQFVNHADMPFFYVAGNHDYSNPEMGKVWNKRLGPDYYHFKYQDVLFLCLNSEDEYSKEGYGSISKKQFEYFDKALKQNKDAKWVFLFMHQPLWTQKKSGNWKKLVSSLKNFKHTAFAGHIHDYTSYVVDEANYITLGTTGGGSNMRGKAYGEVDHFTVIQFKDGKPIISNILLDGIQRHDFVTEESNEIFAKLEQRPPVYFTPQYKDENYQLEALELVLDNSQNYELKVDMKAYAHAEIFPSIVEIHEVVPANTKKSIAIPVNVTKHINYENLSPLAFETSLQFTDLKNVANQWNQMIKFSPQTLHQFSSNKNEIIVDGKMDEWESLPFKVSDPDQNTKMHYEFGVVDQGEFLYFGVNVIDPIIDFSGGKDLANAESIMIQFDYNDRSVSAFNSGDNAGLIRREWTVLAMPITGESGDVAYKIILPKDADGKYTLTEKGYQAEFRFPKKVIKKRQNGDWKDVRINVRVVDRAHGQSTPLCWQPNWNKGVLGTGIFLNKNYKGNGAINENDSPQKTLTRATYGCRDELGINVPCEPVKVEKILEGAVNFRIPGASSKENILLKENKVYRSDNLNELSASDIKKLEELGIKTIVDFRTEQEIDKKPSKKINTVSNTQVLPIGDPGNKFGGKLSPEDHAKMMEWFMSGQFKKVDSLLTGLNLDVMQLNIDSYEDFVTQGNEQFGAFLRIFADEKNLPMIFHCQGGTDRTGFASAILLRMLGFELESLTRDYLATNIYKYQQIQWLFEASPENLYPFYGAYMDQIMASMKKIDEIYGSFDNYLKKGLKLTEQEIQSIQQNLLQKPQN